MRTIGAEIPDTEVAVILGVWTRIWRLPRGGGRGPPGQALGPVERANDPKGLGEAPPLGAGFFGPLRCAGVEGTSSYGALSSPAI